MIVAITLILLAPIADGGLQSLGSRYEPSIAAVEFRALDLLRRESRCATAEQGRCGEWRYTKFSDGYTALTEYFDTVGELVATQWWSDDGQHVLTGAPISCKEQLEVDLCAAARGKVAHRGGVWQIDFSRLESSFTSTTNADGSITMTLKSAAERRVLESSPAPALPVLVNHVAATQSARSWLPLSAHVAVGRGTIRVGEVEFAYVLQPDPQQGDYWMTRIPAGISLKTNEHVVSVDEHFHARSETYFELSAGDKLLAKFSLSYTPELQ